MKELTGIIEMRGIHRDKTLALATVVQTEGSSYRRPGARMLILPDGRTVGSVSGGCLERNVVFHALEVIASRKPVVLTFDTTNEEDIAYGAGLGCRGVIHILVECIHPLPTGKKDRADLIDFFENVIDRRESGVIATVIRAEGTGVTQVGDRLLLQPSETPQWQGNFEFEHQIQLMAEAEEMLGSNRSKVISCTNESEQLEVFLEVAQAPTPLVIFGAGYDALPLVRLAKEVGYHVTVVDRRPSYATRERFPEADMILLANTEGLPEGLILDEKASVVIMSHNYLTDLAFLREVLSVPLRYAGLMGPRKRAEKMFAELEEDENVPLHRWSQLHNPVGLDIGADGPEQIAISILAEIQANMAGHTGGFLREKKGPIHVPRQMESMSTTRMVPTESEKEFCPA
ncbi:MAG: xanthine and dehydrogenase maturation factor, XdhC/CoxF family [Verrucomicrobiales bacterium]|nr:xanthine and dehydrogenase maturation factor, XdhC/CoxF family [Verrucomicrobiales bacterium]